MVNNPINQDVAEGATSLLAGLFLASGMVSLAVIDDFRALLETVLYSASGQSIMLAGLLGVGSFVLAYALNDNDISDFDDAQTYVTGLGVISLFAFTFVPALNSFATSNPVIGIVILAIETLAFAFVAGYNGKIRG